MLYCIDDTVTGASEIAVIHDAAEADVGLDVVDMSELDGSNGEGIEERPAISLSLPTVTLEDRPDMTADFKSSA